jgi:hypothetical protein
MIFHIFRKDVRLLWPIALGVMLVNIIRVVLTLTEGYGSRAQTLANSGTMMIQEFCLVATGFLIILAVQKDALSGLRQDWLVRPVKRTDLLLSKLLFVVLMVRLPVTVIDFAECLAAGFPVGKALSVAVGRGIWVFFGVDILFFTFAALTRNLAEVIVAGLAVFSAGAALQTFSTHSLGDSAAGTFWIAETLQTALFLASAGVVVGLVYYRRKTIASRWIFGTAIAAVAVMSSMFPWQKAFAIQEMMSAEPDAARPVQLSYDPGFGEAKLRMIRGRSAGEVVLYVPLRVQNEQASQLLYENHLGARVTESNGVATDLQGAWNIVNDDGRGNLFQPISVPRELMARIRDRAVRLDIDLALTLSQQNSEKGNLAPSDEKYIEGLGRCTTTKTLTSVELRCFVPGRAPCTRVLLQSTGTGRRFDMNRPCPANYAPGFENTQNEAVTGFRASLYFLDPVRFQPLYGLSEAETRDMRVVVETYRPLAHFTRHVTIDHFRISDATNIQ